MPGVDAPTGLTQSVVSDAMKRRKHGWWFGVPAHSSIIMVSEQKGSQPSDQRWSLTGNSEVISIGAGEKIVGLGECGDKHAP